MKLLKLHVPLMVIVMTMMTISSRGQTTLLWSETAGTAASGQKSFVATDLVGNIYMASSVNGTYGLDWKVSSWRPDSVSRWTYTYNGAGNQDDVPAAIVVDSAFNVYVVGTITSGSSNDIRVIKLDSAGNLRWGTNYNRTGSAHDVGTSLAVVGDKLWVGGHSQQSTSNYDYTLLKYDTAGTLSWSRHADGSASGDDYTTALAVNSNGDAYITGSAVVVGTGSIRDIMTLRYTTDGTLSWTKYYGGTTGQHDYGNDVKVDASGNILVTGQTFVGTNNSNLVLIKYTSGGTQSWAATYSGASKKHDAGNALIVGSDGYYYVTGFMQTSAGTNNYVTIRYNSSGTVSWAQTYDGPGTGDDEACAIIEDGNDIVITGKSTGSGTGLDVCTVSMVKSSGTVNWTMRINESGSNGDWGWSLCRDEMGNVVVSGMAQMSGSSFGNVLMKFNQASKNNEAIRTHLEVLANGIVGIENDTASKRVLYDMAILCVDSFYKASLIRFLQACDQQSLNTRQLIHSEIISAYGYSNNYAWENILSLRIYTECNKRPAMIYVPGLENFSRTEFIASSPGGAFAHGETDFPILSVPDHTELYEEDFLSVPVLTLVAQPVAWWKKDTPLFIYCYGERTALHADHCSACGNHIAIDGLQQGLYCNSLMAHEVGIRIGYGHNTQCNQIYPGTEVCLNVKDLNDNLAVYPQYALLYAMPGYNYYERIGTASYIKIKKVQFPIYSVFTQQFAVAMTLCDDWKFDFNDYHGYSGYTEDYALSWGGVYRISRPGSDQLPVYFGFPYALGLRYEDGPDINVYYSTTDSMTTCANGNHEIEEDYFLGGCEICDVTESVFGLTQNQAADILATTDYQTISGYWLDNVITVGFLQHGGRVDPNNHRTFNASSSPGSCTPSTYNPVSLTPICSLQLLSTNEYEVRKDFNGSASYGPGTELLIHVRATFDNGESIDECQLLTLANTQVNMENVTVEIRGGINDYSTTAINYQVDIYLMP